MDAIGLGKLSSYALCNNMPLHANYMFHSDQKAQLLLVNIAIAADILELFDLMREEEVRSNPDLVNVVLTLWSCSLIQVSRLHNVHWSA